MARRSRVLLILILFIGLAFLLTGCLKKIDVTLTVAIQGLGETDPDVGAHVFKYGAIVTLTATPAEGYDFEKWEIEGLGSFNESVKEIKLKDSILATAFFAKKSFNIEASVDPENGGIVTGIPVTMPPFSGSTEASILKDFLAKKAVANMESFNLISLTLSLKLPRPSISHFSKS